MVTAYRLKAGRERSQSSPADYIQRWNLDAQLDMSEAIYKLIVDHSSTPRVAEQLAAIDQWLASIESITKEDIKQDCRSEGSTPKAAQSNTPVASRVRVAGFNASRIPDSIMDETLETLPKRVAAMSATLNRVTNQAPLRLIPRLSVFQRQSVELAKATTARDVVFWIWRLRTQLVSASLKAQQDHVRRRENKAHKARVDAINQWFEYHPRLTVIHCIFCPVPHAESGNPDESWPVDFETLRADRDRFLKALRAGSYSLKAVVGYLWRLYYAPEGGFRLAMVLLFDPDSCDQPVPEIIAGVHKAWHKKSNAAGLVLSANTRRVQQSSKPPCPLTPSPKQRAEPRGLTPEIMTQLHSGQLGTVVRDNQAQMRDLQSLINWLSSLEHYTQLYLPSMEASTAPTPRAPRNQGHGEGPALQSRRADDGDSIDVQLTDQNVNAHS